MNIVMAVALLVMLFAHIGKKSRSSQPAQVNRKKDDLNWIDELEILDAVLDD